MHLARQPLFPVLIVKKVSKFNLFQIRVKQFSEQKIKVIIFISQEAMLNMPEF